MTGEKEVGGERNEELEHLTNREQNHTTLEPWIPRHSNMTDGHRQDRRSLPKETGEGMREAKRLNKST